MALDLVRNVLKPQDAEAWNLLAKAAQVPKKRPQLAVQQAASSSCCFASGADGGGDGASPRRPHFDTDPMFEPFTLTESSIPECGSLPRPALRNPLDRVWELEHQVSQGLAAVLKEERQNAALVSQYNAERRQRDAVASARTAVEAELDFCRLVESPAAAPGAPSGPSTAASARIAELQGALFRSAGAAAELLEPPAMPGLLAPSRALEDHISCLLQACRDQAGRSQQRGCHAVTSNEELAAVHALGELLVEVDREMLRMSFSLAHVAEDPIMARAVESLTGTLTMRPAVSMNSLSEHLEMENDILKDAMRPVLQQHLEQ